MKPKYQHDCDACTFLGQDSTGKYDLYYCPQGGILPTVIARYGDGDNYYSGLYARFRIPVLMEAFDRAVARGLLAGNAK
jgi:hypothetical protein